ncbi:MAG: DnaA regulatory inactivator Hda [Xanthomonadales bacterium]|nr:DnaA regulatory inactivator Hda [Xanthomonadales bacterium]ODU93773.1 MAG: DnaA regulatory inactivator Hda [Rhodanobacter sp. SCN 66-43]OJY83264.1 MAG: DnaA regulatory inactivator Hda [Xanthomonadales bacterium 66-474]
MNRQFPLDLRWPPHQRLDAFWPGANVPALQGVSDAVEGGDAWLYLQGGSGTGKSHLLIGACRAAIEANRPARYVSLVELPAPRAETIAAIEAEGLLAIDDVQAITGDREAERALFDLYNRAKVANARVLFAADASPLDLGIGLPDLVSRLAMCTQYVLRPLDDAGRRAMLRLLAGRMGLRLDDDVLDWWFARRPRDPASLVAMLQQIDRAALAAQRRVTIPFLRELWQGD